MTMRGTNTHCFWSIWTGAATLDFATGGGVTNDTTTLCRPMSGESSRVDRVNAFEVREA
jgi:hypothetical protein